jgi:hypothetical protein
MEVPAANNPMHLPPFHSFDNGPDLGPFYCAAPNGTVGLCSWVTGWSSPSLENYQCADMANDPANCGGWGYYGFACPAGQTCQQGVCSGTPAECGIGKIGSYCDLDAGTSFVCCPGVGCTDTSSDSANCGWCGVTCASGQACDGGICG